MLMYSASHIMQWFSGCLDVFTPKIRQFFFFFNFQIAYTRLKWSQHSVLLWFSSAYCNDWLQFSILWTLIPNKAEFVQVQVIPVLQWAIPQKHGDQQSSLLLYSISMYMTMPERWSTHRYGMEKPNLNTIFCQHQGSSWGYLGLPRIKITTLTCEVPVWPVFTVIREGN